MYEPRARYSEVSQKEKNTYCVTMHIYRIWRNGTDESISMAATDSDRENRLWTQRGKERGPNRESSADTCPSPRVRQKPVGRC